MNSEDLDHDHNSYLIYDRHFETGKVSSKLRTGEDIGIKAELDDKVHHASTYEARALRNEQSPSDDLGIIDLDNDEDDEDDLFDVDDDKLPILKNIFSKKNRPNNRKSVAIGSRSQGGTMKIRPQIDTIKASKRQINLA